MTLHMGLSRAPLGLQFASFCGSVRLTVRGKAEPPRL